MRNFYQIRSYESSLVAETIVDGNFNDAWNKAFKILADFIFGNNTTSTKRVKIREIPKRKVAEYRNSGSRSESRFKTKLSDFNLTLERENIKSTGVAYFARFNSPFQLWFLRRNEIWLEVAK